MSRFTKIVLFSVLFAFSFTMVAAATTSNKRVYTVACAGSKRKGATILEQVTCKRYNTRGAYIGRLPLFFTVNVTVRNASYWQSTGMGKSLLLRSEWVIN